ncbi:DUF4468 domain-containing protein [Aquimarina sp. 2-A2]|uniref:DUF4468 domain-containing protein n=1 Tax=Aquimarina sp. 2-A2 TaxID=3382644 RepID=UPI00387F16D8
MKFLLSFFTLSLLFVSCAPLQTTPVAIDAVEKTINAQKEKDKLFVIANSWMVQTFKDAKSVVQFTDKDQGVVMGKYLLNTTVVNNTMMKTVDTFDVYAVIKLQVKDGQTRISIDPYDFSEIKSMYVPNPYLRADAMNDINTLIASYEDYINNYTDSF